METGFQRGISRAQNSMTSQLMRTAGPGGIIHSFCAMYSFSMSFCSVPPRRARGMPRASAAATYIASAMDAVALMVMEVVTSPSGIPSKRISKSRREEMLTPSLPTSPRLMAWSAS
jgi:hypothetical protein